MPFSARKFRQAALPHLEDRSAASLRRITADIEQEKRAQQKAALIKSAVDLVESQCSRKECISIMQGCHCLGQSVIAKVQRLYRSSRDIEDWLVKMNDNALGGVRFQPTGNRVRVIYDKCYCGSVSQTRELFSDTYCHCSCGWLKQLFEQTLGAPVKVTLVNSIIQGAEQCEFIITCKKLSGQ
jgi:predicted hydrocarbon binding protein